MHINADHQKAQSLVEFAVILPFLLLILLALSNIGFLIYDYMKLANQVRELARYCAKGSDFARETIGEGVFEVAKVHLLTPDNSAIRATYITIDHEDGQALMVGNQVTERGLIDAARFPDIDPSGMVRGHQEFIDEFGQDAFPITWVVVDLVRWHEPVFPIGNIDLRLHEQATFRVAHIRAWIPED